MFSATTNVILWVAAAVLLVLYLRRRRARLSQED
jgi:hypothetical protein